MSHETRTPLNAILGFGQILQISPDMEPKNKEMADEIVKAGNHLLDLINEILDLSAIESGKSNLKIQQTTLSPIIHECITLTETQANKRNITINKQLTNEDKVHADPRRLKQAVLNLLSNAIKYNKDNGSVLIETETYEDKLRISIIDTGQGIDEKHLNSIFQPFDRLGAEHSNIEGAGIGLTITKRLVELMDGIIGLDSKKDIGSTFWIEIPRVA